MPARDAKPGDDVAPSRRLRVSPWRLDRTTCIWTLSDGVMAAIGAASSSHADVMAALRRVGEPAVMDDLEASLAGARTDGADVDVTGLLTLADGQRWVRAVGYRLRDDRGEVCAFEGVLIDVTSYVQSLTDLRQLNVELREREDELLRMIDRTPGALLVIDADDRIVSVNERFVSLFGYTVADIPDVEAWKTRAFPDPEYQQYIASLRAQRIDRAKASDERTTTAADIVVRCADGRSVDVEAHLTQFRSQRLVMFHDLTERKRTERELRRAAAVFHAGTQGVAIADPNLVVAAANPPLLSILRRGEHEVIGRPLIEVLGGSGPGASLQRTLEQIRRDGEGEGEAWCRRADGQRVALHVDAVCLRDDEGRVIDHVVTVSDVTAARNAERDLAYLAHHDPLTRLPNRHRFAEVLRAALDAARAEQMRVAVLFLDLDHFKTINDSLGHSVGDRLLSEVAHRLGSTVREHDALARLGGDEFVVVLRDAESDDAVAAVAERIRQAFDTAFTIGRRELRVGVSIGVSRYPLDGDTADALLRNADAAMYRAKEAGRGGYRFYDPTFTDDALQRLTLENALRDALDAGTIDVAFQPLVDVADGRIVALEALARWRDGEGREVPPHVFVEVAERTGAIDLLGHYVLDRACQLAAPWVDAGWIERIAVNVSGLQLRRPGFADRVAAVIEAHVLSAACLELELTETSLMRDVVQHGGEFDDLRRIGVALAVDDFGTGYSSLAQLKMLPVNTLKIDRSFVSVLTGDADDVAIVRAIVALGRALGLRVVAEGVESEAQLQFARALGCDLAQGWLVGRPADADATEALLRRHAAR